VVGDFNAQKHNEPSIPILENEQTEFSEFNELIQAMEEFFNVDLSSIFLPVVDNPNPFLDTFAQNNPDSNLGTDNKWENIIQGKRRIDYIFSAKTDMVVDSYIFNPSWWDTVSDHHPVVSSMILIYPE